MVTVDSGDELEAALASRLEAALGDVGPALVPALLPAILAAVRDAACASPVTVSPGALLTVTEAARRLGIGRTTTFALMRTGELRSVTVGRRRLVPAGAIDEFVAGLERATRGSARVSETTVR